MIRLESITVFLLLLSGSLCLGVRIKYHHLMESELVDITDVTPAPRPSSPSLRPACANDLEHGAPCELDEEYNAIVRARIDTLINRNGGAEAILNNPILKTLLEEVTIGEEEGPSERSGSFGNEVPMCAGEATVIFPKRAKTAKDDWVFVVNQGEVKQGVKFEKCVRAGRKCNLGAAGSEIETVCRQKYIYKKVLVLNGNASKIVTEEVLIPSCCVCHIVK